MIREKLAPERERRAAFRAEQEAALALDSEDRKRRCLERLQATLNQLLQAGMTFAGYRPCFLPFEVHGTIRRQTVASLWSLLQHDAVDLAEALADVLGEAEVTIVAVPIADEAGSDDVAEELVAHADGGHGVRIRTADDLLAGQAEGSEA